MAIAVRKEILVVEDEPTQANALKEAFTRLGLVVHTATRIDEAREIMHSKPIGTAFIDCLLPAGSGVELAEEFRTQHTPRALQLVLMSGIFTDGSFIKESVRTTQAQAFLKKPFDLAEVIELVKPKGGEEMTPRKRLYQLFSRGKVSARDKKRAIEALEEIHGFDLPFIYSLLSESKSSGHLNVVASGGEVFGVSFSQGNIVAVDVADKETYLGKILVDRGYVHPEDLKAVLDSQLTSQSNRRLGDRLIQACAISPHSLDIAMTQQMNIRLSRTVIDQMVKVNFVDAEVDRSSPSIDSESFTEFLHDWIASKISSSWLKEHFLQWSDHNVITTPSAQTNPEVLKMPLIAGLDNLMSVLGQQPTLRKILDSQQFPEETLYKGLFLLLTKGLIVFSGKQNQVTPEERRKTLAEIYEQMEGRSPQDVVNMMVRLTGLGESDLEQVCKEFINFLGEPPEDEQTAVRSLYDKTVQLAEKSHQHVIKHKGQKDEDAAKKSLESRLRAATDFEEAKKQLQRGSYKQALQLIRQAATGDPGLDKIRLYKAWAKLGLIDPNNPSAKHMKDIEMELVQVSPEDKIDALYHFDLGLFHKLRQEYAKSRKFLEKALAIDPGMVAAKRELNLVAITMRQKGDVLNRDLKDLVSSFFKRK